MTSEEKSVITDLNKCGFSEMSEYFKAQSEARKQMSKEEKQVFLLQLGALFQPRELWDFSIYLHTSCRKSKRKMNGSFRSMVSASWTTTRRESEISASSRRAFSEDGGTIQRWACWSGASDPKTSLLTVASRKSLCHRYRHLSCPDL